jgi:AraC-like DNA-binding protein
VLVETGGVSVVVEQCPATVAPGPRELQGRDCFEVLFVRAGSFTYRDSRGAVFVDPTTCVLGGPRQVAELAHPTPGGDTDTIVLLSADAWHELTGDERVPLCAPVTGSMQVAQRALLAGARRGVARMALEEEVLNLAAAALAQVEPARVAAGRPPTVRSRRQLAEDARTILVGDPAVSSVRAVAARLACSPHHLSRVFHEHTGMTLASYRTRLRVNLALELLADGGIGVAEVASRCGFADHAHLTRVLRRHTGSTPSVLQSALT